MSAFESSEPHAEKPNDHAKWVAVALVVVSTAFAILYKTVDRLGFAHTSMMFVGIPAVLAILLALLPRAKSATGAIVKGITFAMLIVAPLLGEGYLCILMASPLFYVVGVIVGAVVDWNRKKRGMTLSCCALVILPLALEGVAPGLTFNRLETVAVARTVEATPEEVEQALARSPRIATPLPGFLSIGFPRPLAVQGEGLGVGSRRTIHFSGAEGDPPGDLVTEVTDSYPGFVRTRTVSDSSKLTQWIRWESSEVMWRAVDATHTMVVWRIAFERQLDPAWYFIPWERFAAREAAGYMIAANATPGR
jgi:hypothetical protein